ncbi:MAG: hypothetical protein JW863_06905 [Chitinispirillaceae bacterium]|nr:hypothetical protein [Chitinispirillaceae bacterium]
MIRRTLHILFGIWITVLFTVVIPTHTHDDHDDHDTCSICLLAGQTATTAATIFLTVIVAASTITCCFITSSVLSRTLLAYHTRAPPVVLPYS